MGGVSRCSSAQASPRCQVGDDAVRTLHGLDVRNLGLVGTQRMLAEVGVRSCRVWSFVRCALNRVSWASAAESWEVRTVRARSYALVRFGLKGATEVRGDFVLNNTCVSSEESALLPTAISRGRAVLLAVSGTVQVFLGSCPFHPRRNDGVWWCGGISHRLAD